MGDRLSVAPRPQRLVPVRHLIRGDSLAGAIAATVAYSDIFAFAPTTAEIHRFLLGQAASRADVRRALHEDPGLQRLLDTREGYWFFRGKSHLAPRRIRFSRHSAYMWPRARKMAKWVASSGLARCGMVTGSLAADNADEHADIDFLFVYPKHRTYLSYAGVRMMVGLPGAGLGAMCPNYALSDDHLAIQPRNLFTAWEIAKAVPMFGFDVYADFATANRWVRDYLPNALPVLDGARPTGPDLATEGRGWTRRLTQSAVMARLESMERDRKQGTDRRDVGVNMRERGERGSMDRHSPTRSFHTLSELRYRLEQFSLQAHPLYAEVASSTAPLGAEMTQWGGEAIATPPADDSAAVTPTTRAG